MLHAHLDNLLHAQPFRPFRITLTNGNAHEVRHPEFFMLLPGTVIIGHPDAGESGDLFTIVDLSHIAEAEPLPASAPGGSNGAAGS
jgi:hypothetical protein